MKLFTKKMFSKTVIIVLILSIIMLLLNYFITKKIRSDIFKKPHLNTVSFMESYASTNIQYKSEYIKLYIINHPSSKEYIFYVPDSVGILNSILNSMALKYNLIILEYPQNPKFQNFTDLKRIFELTISELGLRQINLKNIILFGHGIGGNVVLSSSKNQDFKSVLILNPFPNEKDYCNSFFSSGLCLLVKPSFAIEDFNQNLVYYFFNENIFNLEKNYDIFNSVNAYEKFLFEIPGTDMQFNFNHILEFYNNESLIQEENFESSIIEEGEEVIDVDGLLNPDKYMD